MSTSISILGNTGRDVELRYTPQGTPVARFSVASNTVRNTPQGQVKKTDWFNVTAFGKQAETLSKHLKKGSQILVRGRLTFNPWLGRDGEPRVGADVALQDFEFAGGAAAGNQPAATENANRAAQSHPAKQPASVENAEDAAGELTADMMEAMNETDGGGEPYLNQF